MLPQVIESPSFSALALCLQKKALLPLKLFCALHLRRALPTQKLFFLTIAFFISLNSGAALTSAEEIKIGVILPLSGPASGVGETIRTGAQLALRDLNAAGGVEGVRFKLIIEDTASETKNAVSAFNKLYSNDGVRIFLTVVSSAAMALKPMVESRHALLFADVAHPEILKDSQYIIRHSNTAQWDAQTMAKQILPQKPKNIGILYQYDDWGVAYEKELRRAFEAEGIKVFSESKLPSDSDLTPMLTKLRPRSLEALILVLYGSSAGEAIKKAKLLGFSGNLSSSVGFILTPDAATVAGEAAIGTWFQTFVQNPQFKAAYKEAYGKDAPLLGQVSYTDLELIAWAIKETKSRDPKTLAEQIKKMTRFTGRYEEVHITPQGDVFVETHLERFTMQGGNP